MNKCVLRIGNSREIIKTLNKNKKKTFKKNVYNSTLKCLLINASTINFKGTYSRLFWNKKNKPKLEQNLKKKESKNH